jgi:predicted DNA-binding ribbon-helix-helix protein
MVEVRGGFGYAARDMEFDAARSRSSLVPRNVVVGGRRTSIRLEKAMWDALGEILEREAISASDFATLVERGRKASTLTAAIRVHIMEYFRAAATESGHRHAGHGSLRRRYRTQASVS